jgi:hypothetical protein
MKTVIRHTLTAFGAVSLATFAVVFGAALARDRKRQRAAREQAWLQGGVR